MKLTSQLTSTLVVAGLLSVGALPSHGADLLYNFSFELTNSAAGVDLFTDGSFLVDPTTATTGHGPNAVGETFAAPVDSLAFTVADLGAAQSIGSVNYSKSDLQNAGLVYFPSFNPATGLADPIFTLSAADSSGFLTLVLDGSSASFYQSATLGLISGTPIATGPAQLAQTLDVSATPEPTTVTLFAVAASLFLAAFLFRRYRATKQSL